MRLIKMLSLLIIALAVVGADSEMAEATPLEEVVWCQERVVNCPVGKRLPEAIFHAKTGNGETEFLTNAGTVSCETSKILLENKSSLVHGEVTALTFSGCTLGKTACTLTAENLNYLFKGMLTTNDLEYEIILSEKNPNGMPQISAKCGSLISCVFGAKEISIAALLPIQREELSVLDELPPVKGLFCGNNTEWHGRYAGECESEGAELQKCWVKMELIV